MIDFGPLRRKEASLQDLATGLNAGDLARLTREMCAAQLSAFEDATDDDVVMVPDDPDANDTFANVVAPFVRPVADGVPSNALPSFPMYCATRPASCAKACS